ncbi:GNAT family N-acetyltransferase [Shinella yambaruensis]|uniref:GNAT family N-acetyltransferase n=1 Tax=Shinella yambaruensis TaxID=415996 RepID=UPI003D7A5CA7
MQLIVREADASDLEYAWSLYQPFIVQHIFPRRSQFQVSTADEWSAAEGIKFPESIKSTEVYIILVDDARVGWCNIVKINNRIVIQNIFIDEEWKSKGIAQRLFDEMIPQWKSEKRVVEVPVLLGTPYSDLIAGALEAIGFTAAEEDGLVRSMIANWSK